MDMRNGKDASRLLHEAAYLYAPTAGLELHKLQRLCSTPDRQTTDSHHVYFADISVWLTTGVMARLQFQVRANGRVEALGAKGVCLQVLVNVENAERSATY